jgi:DNA polymerase-3 subunit beta
MKLTCTKENLNLGLMVAGHLSNKNVNLPILNNVLLEAKNNVLKLSTTNLEIGINCTVRGKVEVDGVFTADSKLLADFVNLLPNENVEIELVKDDYLNVKCKNNNTRVKGIPADDFPVIPQIEKVNPYQISLKEFKEAVGSVIFAVSNNETRPEINGLYMSFGDGAADNLTLVGTDSYRLAEKKVKLAGNQEKKEVIVPVKALQEVLRILGGLKDGGETPETLEVYISENQILFVIGSIELISRLAEGQYPDYKQIIPKEAKTTVIVSTEELAKVIRTSALFSKAGIFDVNLEFVPESKSIVISSNNVQVGESVSEVSVDFTGEKNATTLNYRFLLDGLSNIAATELELSLVDMNIPCVLRPKGDASYTYIVMPIRQ